MKLRLIYPKWEKLAEQTNFNLPPHGPVVMAAALPEDVEVEFLDENVQEVVFDEKTDLVAISVMLTAQIRRAWQISDQYRKMGKKVIFGGIATMLHAQETLEHADAIFLGEAEGRMHEVIKDFRNNNLKKVYNYLLKHPDMTSIGTARREILTPEFYFHKGVRMVDLVHASRGCQFSCYPCCANFLGGKLFRPRPVDKVIEELESIDNNRLFIVDNSLAQDKQWEKDLFKAMIPLKKKWCSHTIEDKPEVLDLAAQAGAWYVYQAIFDTSDYIKERIKKYRDHGIMVEGTVLLGMDNQTEKDILELIDFLMETDLDLAEFTVLTPFRHTKAYDDMVRQGRIIDKNWDNYNAGKVVFQPKNMTPERLQELYHYAWNTFYEKETQEQKMFKLILNVVEKEIKDGTFKTRRDDLANVSFGNKIKR